MQLHLRKCRKYTLNLSYNLSEVQSCFTLNASQLSFDALLNIFFAPIPQSTTAASSLYEKVKSGCWVRLVYSNVLAGDRSLRWHRFMCIGTVVTQSSALHGGHSQLPLTSPPNVMHLQFQFSTQNLLRCQILSHGGHNVPYRVS